MEKGRDNKTERYTNAIKTGGGGTQTTEEPTTFEMVSGTHLNSVHAAIKTGGGGTQIEEEDQEVVMRKGAS